ncbi:FxSxx-COOH system tetratricopeptide repeat protein [Streptomyces sp. NPDC058914]|uniref:FxSxx-COOH system tetratricopeptide repeat protein n=1 Tax=Streptomyces sp. NPDC058914 TaxID=3346671 RepID=UPI0036ADB862
MRVFISHAGADRAWAEWVGWQLTDAGCSVTLTEPRPGRPVFEQLSQALRTARAVFVLVSASTGNREWGAWESALPRGGRRRLIVPVRVDDTPLPPFLADRQGLRLDELDEEEARRQLLLSLASSHDAATVPPGSPDTRAPFAVLSGERVLRRLGLAAPRLPGSLPRVWNLPPRNSRFVGRDETLARLRLALTDHARLVVTGPGGSGKTQLALEYAYRFAGQYELAWWVRPGLVGEQLAELAVRTGAATPGTPLSEAQEALKAELRTRSRWLLVVDGATDPRLVEGLLPRDSAGHVLVTSTAPRPGDDPLPFPLEAFTRAESVELLRGEAPRLTSAECDELAAALDDLPLALTQAAGVLRDEEAQARGMDVREFLRRLSDPDEADGRSVGHARPLVTATRLSVEQLRREGPGVAVDMLFGCVLLAAAPVPIPLEHHAWDDPDPLLLDVLPGPSTLARVLKTLETHSLVRVRDGRMRLHPHIRSVLRNLLNDDDRPRAARMAEALLLAALPDDLEVESAKERWTDLLPHLLAIDARDLTTDTGRQAALNACGTLVERGDAATARDRLVQLRETWQADLGHGSTWTLKANLLLSSALTGTGESERAVATMEMSLRDLRQAHGEDHPQTLAVAGALTLQLAGVGRSRECRRLGDELLPRMRRTLGDDHLVTLVTVVALAMGLNNLDERPRARDLAEEAFVRSRRALGESHRLTVLSAFVLAMTLMQLGQPQDAQRLMEDIQHHLGSGPESHVLRAAIELLGFLNQVSDEGGASVDSGSRPIGPDQMAALFKLASDLWTAHAQPGGGHDVARALRAQDRAGTPGAADAHTAGVLVVHAPADAAWAHWVADQLTEWRHHVLLRPVPRGNTDVQSLLTQALRDADVVVILCSSAYFLRPGTWRDSSWARTLLRDHVEDRRLVPVFLESTEVHRLPAPLRGLVSPSLPDLDEEAAQDLLRYSLDRPGRAGPEHVFPGVPMDGAPEPNADTVLARQLVNALVRSPALSSRAGLESWLALISTGPVPDHAPHDVPLRVQLIGVVRGLMRAPGGLRDLLDALELLDDPDSTAVGEVRRIVERIENSGSAR